MNKLQSTSICLILAAVFAAPLLLAAAKPNIIVIKTDDQRWDSLSAYGDPVVKTPNIDRLSEEGTRFENVFTVSPLCGPSRTSFFTGTYPSKRECFDNATYINPGDNSFLESLKEAGYKIGLSGKNHCFTEKYFDTVFDFREEYGPWGKEKGTMTEADIAVHEYRNTQGPSSRLGNKLLEGLIDFPEPFPVEHCITSRIADDAITFVESNKDDPFFLYVAFPAPHWPNIVAEPYFSMYMDQLDAIGLPGMDEIDWDNHPFAHFVQSQATGFDKYTKEERRKVLAIMYGQISFIDHSVGRIVESLKAQGLYEETVIVFTSDQGCFGGQFGLPSKTKGFYESLIRIPLVIKMPGDQDRGKVTPAEISNIDIMPTLLDYAKVPHTASIDGRSFLDVLEDKTDTHRTTIYSEVGQLILPPAPMSKKQYPAYNEYREQTDGFWFIEYTVRGRCAMIREDGWKYCYYNGDMEELYNYAEDPLELENLAYHPDHIERKIEMQKKLFQQGFAGIDQKSSNVKW
jgi:arylsulfatase A-like enzyme